MRLNNRKGFTLIELLVVVLIIGILASIAVPQYFKAVEKARVGEATSALASIRAAADRYFANTGTYPITYGKLDIVYRDSSGKNMTGTGALLKFFNVTLGQGDNTATATRVGTSGTYGLYTIKIDYRTGGLTIANGKCRTEDCNSLIDQ